MFKKYPAVPLLVAIIFGIVISDKLNCPLWLTFSLLNVSLLAAVAAYFKNRQVMTMIAVLIAMASASAFTYTLSYLTFPPHHVAHLADDGNRYRLYCTVVDWPVLKEHRTQLYCRVDYVADESGTRESRGKIILTIARETTSFQAGDRIFFETRVYGIRGGPSLSGFDYSRYLNLKGVFARCYLPHEYAVQRDQRVTNYLLRMVDKVRFYIIETFRDCLPSSAAAVASGFLIGETRDIPPEIYDHFRDTGTLHLLAVSGSNVWLVVLVFVFILQASPWSLRSKTIFLLIVIVFFSYLSYNQPSVVRASVMAALVLIGRLCQRKLDLNNIIASAGVIILLYDPAQFFDIGFQLSFITAWGIIFLVPKITPLFNQYRRKWHYKSIIIPVLVSVAAQLVALPLSVYYFHRLPAISFISNLVIIPTVAVIVVGQIIVLFAFLILPSLGIFFGALLNPLFDFTLWALRLFGEGEFGIPLPLEFDNATLLVYYIILILLVLSLTVRQFRRWLVFGILIAGNLFLIRSIAGNSDRDRILVFDTGGDMAVLYQSKRSILLPCGIHQTDISEWELENEIIPYLHRLGIKAIDLIPGIPTPSKLNLLVETTMEFDTTRFFLPENGRPAMHDVILQHRISPIESENKSAIVPIFYSRGETAPDPDSLRPGIILGYENPIIRLDSAIVFLGYPSDFEIIRDWAESKPGLAFWIIANDCRSDLFEWSENLPKNFDLTLICGSHGLSRLKNDQNNPDSASFIPKVIQTSQVGDIELFIDNGRLKPNI